MIKKNLAKIVFAVGIQLLLLVVFFPATAKADRVNEVYMKDNLGVEVWCWRKLALNNWYPYEALKKDLKNAGWKKVKGDPTKIGKDGRIAASIEADYLVLAGINDGNKPRNNWVKYYLVTLFPKDKPSLEFLFECREDDQESRPCSPGKILHYVK